MKLYQSIILSLTIFLLAVGIHQTSVYGFAASYWIYMLVFVLLGIYGLVTSKSRNSTSK